MTTDPPKASNTPAYISASIGVLNILIIAGTFISELGNDNSLGGHEVGRYLVGIMTILWLCGSSPIGFILAKIANSKKGTRNLFSRFGLVVNGLISSIFLILILL